MAEYANTPRGRFIIEHHAAIDRAAIQLQNEFGDRGIILSATVSYLIAVNICATFADIKDVPASS